MQFVIEFWQFLCYLVSQSQELHYGVGTRAITGGGVPWRKRHYGAGIEVAPISIGSASRDSIPATVKNWSSVEQ